MVEFDVIRTEISKLELKENDILVIKLPEKYYRLDYISGFFKNFKKTLKIKNKVLFLTDEMLLTVVADNIILKEGVVV